MAKVKEITKSISMKFGTFAFANSDLFACVSMTVEDGDDPMDVSRQVDQLLDQAVSETKAVLDEKDINFYKLPQKFPGK